MAILTYKGNKFFLDGEEYTIISGAMHYFRIPREYWHDRLLKLKECGFNNLEAYIDIANELGLNVILRPGPYICAEWEMGGLPAWLLNYPNLTIRCNDELFISKVERYYNELLGRIVPKLSTNGGNIIMMQIENEYGSYGDDHEYMQRIATRKPVLTACCSHPTVRAARCFRAAHCPNIRALQTSDHVLMKISRF